MTDIKYYRERQSIPVTRNTQNNKFITEKKLKKHSNS